MNKMCVYSGIFLAIMVASTQASMDLTPLERASCPTDNHYSSHICYEMTYRNVSCDNDWTFCNIKTSGKNTIHTAPDFSNINSIQNINRIFEVLELLHNSNQSSCDGFDKQCTVHSCTEKCCEGWAKDSNGHCYIELDTYHCLNGGSWSHNNGCECKQGFSGPRCENVECAPPCLNGGTCSATPYGNRCNCPGPYYGLTCERAECSVACLNGGECAISNFEPTCRCKEGYTGKNCAYKLDLKHCPMPNTSVCTDLWCDDKCQSSDDCDNGLVCCNTGCCNSCVRPPMYQTCTYNGQVYRPGQTFTRDKCTVCMCLRNGSIDCVQRSCSDRLPCDIHATAYVEDECCPFCDHGDLPPEYHRPVLNNCPHDAALLTVSHFTSRAYMSDFGIWAYDYRNSEIAVNYRPLYLEHCRCPMAVRESQLVVVSTVDRYGLTSECRFRVMVIDKTPPEFKTCPTTIYATNNERVTWNVPQVKDNVGILHLTLSPPGWGNDGYFTIGNHTMTYTATDYDGNPAFCQFTVFVYDKNIPPSQMPPGLSRRQTNGHRNIQIIAGCLSVFFLVIAGTLAFCYVKRWRHSRPVINNATINQQRHRRREPPIPSVSNGLYDGGSLNFTGLDSNPPPYSPSIPPPAYEELAVMGSSAFKTEEPEQPPKYEDLYTHAYSYANRHYQYNYDNRMATESVEREEVAFGSDQGQGQNSQEPEYDIVEFNRGATSSRGSGPGGRMETII